MGTISLILLVVWLLGIAMYSIGVVMMLKDESVQTEEVRASRLAMELNPTVFLGVTALAILVWPFSLLFGALKKGSN